MAPPSLTSADAGHRVIRVEVKAAGGVSTLDGLLEVLSVGVSRVGATQTAEILDDYRARTGADPAVVRTAPYATSAAAVGGGHAAPMAPASAPSAAATTSICSIGTRVTR